MRWDAASTVGDRRFNSHIMDSNDPYLHLSKFSHAPPVSLSVFLRFVLISCNRVRFVAIVRGTAPSAHFYQPVSRSPAAQLVANHSLSASACLNLLLIENVR